MRLALEDVIGILVLAGPDRIEIRSAWTLHQVLRTLPGSDDRLAQIMPTLTLVPTPDIGYAVAGVGPALHDLHEMGVLRVEHDDSVGTVLTIRRDRLRPYLKSMMSIDPGAANAIYLAGMAWRALALTAAKILVSDRASFGPIVSSPSPNRCQRPVDLVR
jgi:hypothetical protein